MKTQLKALTAAMGLGMVLASGSAMAESTYGYNAAGAAAAVTATARVNLSVTVPKLILLRVGSTSGTIDTLSWSLGASIPAVPTAAADGNNTAVDWSGGAPTLAPASATATTVASAWTNATTGTINCSVSGLAAGGPTLADFAVSAGAGTLVHPGATLGACASTGFTSGSVKSSTWTYTLGGTPSSWAPGVYTAQVLYTASGI